MRHEIAEALARFKTNERDARNVALFLRESADDAEREAALPQIPTDHPLARKFLTGVIKATAWNEIWGAIKSARIKNLQKAISWQATLFVFHEQVLSGHVKVRNKLIRETLLGQFQQALETLEAHMQTFGPTVWALQWLFLLREENDVPGGRNELLSRFQSQEFGAAGLFASLSSFAVDKALTEETFRGFLQRRNDQAPVAWMQFLQFVFTEDITGRWDASDQLDYAEGFSIIDRYEFFFRLSAMALGDRNSDALKFARGISRISKSIDDRLIKYMAECASERTPLIPADDDMALMQCWDEYMKSNYDKSFSIAYELATSSPHLLAPHEMLVKSGMYLGRRDFLAGKSPLVTLWTYLDHLFRKDDLCDEALTQLERFSSRFRIPTLTMPLRGIHAQHGLAMGDEVWHARSSYLLGVHGPRNFEYGHTVSENMTYLDRCRTRFPDGLAIRFFQGLAKKESVSDLVGPGAIPQIRQFFFSGLAASKRKEHALALKALAEFILRQQADADNPLSPFAIEEARRTLIDLYRLQGDVVNMQKIIVQAFIDRPQAVRRLGIRKLFEECVQELENIAWHIEFPIMAYLACDEPHDVCLALKRFLRTQEVDKPSDLLQSHAHFDNKVLGTLFVRVCTPEVIDAIYALDSVEKVEAERLTLLHWVKSNLPALTRIAESEVLRLTQNALLREALQRVEGAKVVLNLSGLREAEQDRLADGYSHYIAQRNLASAQIDQIMEKIKEVGRGARVVLVSSDALKAEFAGFCKAFREVREVFISSPHFGIEACLSGRIRHGILLQQIRKPFVERKLAVGSNALERQEIEAYWRSRLPGSIASELMLAVMNTLMALTEDVNAIAENVRSTWIQSKIESRNPEGIFDYTFSDEQLQKIKERVDETAGLQGFIDRVLEALIERTRLNLREAQRRIREDLREKLLTAINTVLGKLDQLGSEADLTPLKNQLVAARHNTELGCQEMARWFQDTDTTLIGDADVNLLVRTAIGMVERLNPEFRGRHEFEVPTNFKIEGRHFQALIHILFFLLENSVRHCRLSRDHFLSKVGIAADTQNLIVFVETRMLSDADARDAATKILAKVAELKTALDPTKVVKEGGTGFAKIIAAVRYEFKQPDPILEAQVVSGSLRVQVVMKSKGVLK